MSKNKTKSPFIPLCLPVKSADMMLTFSNSENKGTKVFFVRRSEERRVGKEC